MNRLRINSGLLAAVALLGASAQAATIPFSFTGSGTGTGTLTVAESPLVGVQSTTAFAITGVTGAWNGAAITGLRGLGGVYTNEGNGFSYDNELAVVGSTVQLDGNGFAFLTATQVIRIFNTYPGVATSTNYSYSIKGGTNGNLTSTSFLRLTNTPPRGTNSTTIAMSDSADPTIYGTSVTLFGRVSPSAATGSVTFKEGGTVLGIGTLTNGVAAFITSGLPAGTHSLAAVYPGDASYSGSPSDPFNHTVTQATPSVTAWPKASDIYYGQTLFSSTLTGGTSSVPGTYSWTTPSTKPNAGPSSQGVTFTPTDAVDYLSVTGSVRVTARTKPVVATLKASDIGLDGATVHATINPNGNTMDARFQLITWTVNTLAGSVGYIDYGTGYANGTGTNAQFRFPGDLALDRSGNLYVCDGDALRKVTPAGVVTTLAGSTSGPNNGSSGYVDATGTAARFAMLTGVVVDNSGNVYVSDWGNNRIRKVTPAGVVTTLAGQATTGYADGTGAAAQFAGLGGLAMDASGNIYVADGNNNRIRKVTQAGVVTTLAGTNAGYADGTGAAAKFWQPSAVAVDAGTNVYVADTGNHRIRKVTPAGVVTTVAGSTQGYCDGLGAAAQFNGPTDVAVDTNGTLYVADPGNYRICEVTPAGAVSTMAGSGQGYAEGVGPLAKFYSPGGVTVDASGTVYVGDAGGQLSGNHLIRRMTVGLAGSPIFAQTVAGTKNVNVSLPLTGLLPQSTYYYRALTTNSLGTTSGETLSFRTLATNTVFLVSSQNPTTYRSNVTLTAQVYGPASTPTGIVSFREGTNLLGSGTLTNYGLPMGSARATMTLTNSLVVNSYNFTATYAGDTNYGPGTGTLVVVINRATPVVSVWPTASDIIYGQSLAASTLSGGTVSAEGTFAWTTPGITPGGFASTNGVIFTPTDLVDYYSVTGAVRVVAQVPPTSLTSQPVSLSTVGGTSSNYFTYSASSSSWTNLSRVSPLVFSVSATNAAGYRWYQNGNLLDGENGSNLLVAPEAINNGATFQAVATNVAGSVTSSVATLMLDIPTNTLAYAFDQEATGWSNTDWQATGNAWWATDNGYPSMPKRMGLTPSGANKTGSFWFKPAPINPGQSWKFYWTFQGGYTSGNVADNCGFVIQADGANALVSGPATTTVSGLTGKFLSIALDDYPNSGDPSASTLKVTYGTGSGSQTNFPFINLATAFGSANQAPGLSCVSSGANPPYNLSATYLAASNRLTVTIANTTLAGSAVGGTNNPITSNYTINLASLFGTNVGVVGFNGNNGGAGENHFILNASGLANFMLPVITSQPTNLVKNMGQSASFTVAAVGANSYQWYLNSVPVAGATNATYAIASLSGYQFGSYTVVVGNVVGSVTSSVAGLTSPSPYVSVQPVSAVVSLGASTNLAATGGGTNLTYQWFKDGVKLVGQTNSTLSFASFQLTDSGNYNVVVTNATGMAISFPARLSVANARLKAWGWNLSGQLGLGGNIDVNQPAGVANDVIAAAAGYQHSLFVKADGTLWAMGGNGYGQLGNGTTTATNQPVSVASNVVVVAAGYFHSLFLKGDGTLWAMGANGNGALGNGNNADTNRPVSVASNVVAVAAGALHSLFVKADGTLWAMGWNNSGQLGNGNNTDVNRPVSVASNIVAVAAGGAHSLAVKADGTLWAMGDNYYGQLGNGSYTGTNRPVSVASNTVAVAAGYQHSVFVKADGTLWAMGWNSNGQLGNGTTNNSNLPVSLASNAVAVAAGYYHSLFAKTDGTLWVTGGNSKGELGNGSYADTNRPVAVSGLVVSSLAPLGCATHSLTVAAAVPQPASLTNQSTVVGQPFVFTVVLTNGDGPFTYQWQFNGTSILNATNASYTVASAQMSDAGTYSVAVTGVAGSTVASATLGVTAPLAPQVAGLTNQSTVVGQPFVFTVLLTNGDWPFTYQWQFNGTNLAGATNASYSQANAEMSDAGTYSVVVTNVAGSTSASATLAVATPPVITAQPQSAVVAAGGSASLSVTYIGDAPCGYQWFKDGRKLLGTTNSTLTFGSFGFTNSGSYQLVVTNAYGLTISTPAILSLADAPLKAWGYNSDGQLGNGNTDDQYSPVQTARNVAAAAAGTYHSLFLKNDGTLWAVGANNCGQLGNGTTDSQLSPVQTASNVVALAAGESHSMFLKSDGTLWGIGGNNYGQLGNGNTNDQVWPVLTASNVVAVAAGQSHSLFLKNDGTLWTMGLNSFGQLGNGINNDGTTAHPTPLRVASNVVAVTAGTINSLFAKSDGTLWIMGWNLWDWLPHATPVSVASNVVAVAGGAMHCLFVKSDGTLWAKGLNPTGALGIGNTTDQSSPVYVTSNAVAVAAGYGHSLFAKNDGTLWAMGWNVYGELGNGGVGDQQNSPVQVTNMVVGSLGAMAGAFYSLAVAANTAAAVATVTLSGLSQTYNGSAFGVTANTTPDGLAVSLTYDGSTNQPVNAGSYTVVASVTSPGYIGGATNTLVIAKATPGITTWPTAIAITQGQALSASTLSGGSASVSGAFAWESPATVPPVGTNAQSVVFTPSAYTNYLSVTGSVSVVVNGSGPATRQAVQSGPWNDPATWGGTLPAAGDNIVIPLGITVTLTNNPLEVGNLTIAGTLTVPYSQSLTVSGNFTNTGTFNPGIGTVEFTGGSNTVMTATSPGSLTFYNLKINKDSGTNSVTALSKVKATRKLTLATGKLVSASDYGDVLIETDGTLELTSDITIGGDLVIQGYGVLTTAGHKVTFDGGTNQNLTSEFLVQFDDLTVGTNTTLIETESANNVLVNGTLLNQGVIRKTQVLDAGEWYYFGLAGNYASADMEIHVTDLTGGAPLTAIQVDRIDVNHPNAPGTNTTGIYWTITPTGTNFVVSLALPQDGLPDPQVCRYRNSAWDWARSAFDPNTVTRTNLTAFGDFAVFNDPQVVVTTAVNDTLGALKNTNTTVAASVLTANDIFDPAYTVTITNVTYTGGHGGAVGLAGTNITYTPATDYTGTDAFTYTITDGHGGVSVATVTVTVREGGGSSPSPIGGIVVEGGKVTLTFHGVPNRTYRVQFTPKIGTPDWQDLGTAKANRAGVITFEDTPPGGTDTRYYRIVYP